MTIAPLFYECPSCGFFHSRGAVNPCDDDDQLFEPEKLDELYPTWEEVKLDNPTLVRLQALTPAIDLNGTEITVGSRVRICSFVSYNPETDTLAGIDGDRSYLDGVLSEFTEHEGLPKYKIAVETATDVRRGEPKTSKFADILYVRVNGSESGLGWPMFAVFRAI